MAAKSAASRTRNKRKRSKRTEEEESVSPAKSIDILQTEKQLDAEIEQRAKEKHKLLSQWAHSPQNKTSKTNKKKHKKSKKNKQHRHHKTSDHSHDSLTSNSLSDEDTYHDDHQHHDNDVDAEHQEQEEDESDDLQVLHNNHNHQHPEHELIDDNDDQVEHDEDANQDSDDDEFGLYKVSYSDLQNTEGKKHKTETEDQEERHSESRSMSMSSSIELLSSSSPSLHTRARRKRKREEYTASNDEDDEDEYQDADDEDEFSDIELLGTCSLSPPRKRRKRSRYGEHDSGSNRNWKETKKNKKRKKTKKKKEFNILDEIEISDNDLDVNVVHANNADPVFDETEMNKLLDMESFSKIDAKIYDVLHQIHEPIVSEHENEGNDDLQIIGNETRTTLSNGKGGEHENEHEQTEKEGQEEEQTDAALDEANIIVLHIRQPPPKEDKQLKIKMRKDQQFSTIIDALLSKFEKEAVKLSFDGERIALDSTPQALIDEFDLEDGDLIDAHYT